MSVIGPRTASFLEPADLFEGVGADLRNPRYDPQWDEYDDERPIVEGSPPAVYSPPRGLTMAPRTALINLFARRFDGIDGAHYQWDNAARIGVPIDWEALRRASDWLAWKATQSVKYIDPTFSRTRAIAKRLNFRHRPFYHWLSSTTDPEQQGRHYIGAIGMLFAHEAAMLDAEEAGITVDKCLGWLEYIERIIRRPAAVYTGLYVAGGTIWRDPRIREGKFGPRPMHLAAYVSVANLIDRMTRLGVAHLPPAAWQWSSAGNVPGVPGAADNNQIIDRAVYDAATGIEVQPPAAVPWEAEMGNRLIQVQDDAAVFVVDGTTASFAVSGEVIDGLIGAGLLPPKLPDGSLPIARVNRSTLKALHYIGPPPDYSGADLSVFPEQTTLDDFGSTYGGSR